jgi:hypothetical protein
MSLIDTARRSCRTLASHCGLAPARGRGPDNPSQTDWSQRTRWWRSPSQGKKPGRSLCLADIAHGSPKPVCEGGSAESAGLPALSGVEGCELCGERIVLRSMMQPRPLEKILISKQRVWG